MNRTISLLIALLSIHNYVLFGQLTSERLLLHNINIVDVVDGSVKKNASLVIEGPNILSIGKFEAQKKKVSGKQNNKR